MVNQIILVGRLEKLSEVQNKKELLLKVDRPFKEDSQIKVDIFKCRAWTSIFNKILKLCKIGDLLAIRGRVVYEGEEFVIMAENIAILNKTRENI